MAGTAAESSLVHLMNDEPDIFYVDPEKLRADLNKKYDRRAVLLGNLDPEPFDGVAEARALDQYEALIYGEDSWKK
jgi:hypothetical protein